ncbi:hypothetical protein A3H22_03375 [Candidatus Peribacteria bacterium RIFCSPLOWO2_12_FULL_55_15]|nr:MAG: hypothetical protein A3D12_00215 [Candidatus Peribacteria bacterium RIFCSPHIGHO2_02_FULL_55_24]OGJ69068.1 MAG: hypothetical protein A2947_00350 [Candidatus Peribacteria bacterium RIFCSPLOWO2_01_FULL_54_110]OGJ72313.1 MAG: hypothetical protein A3H22_03375 [Candidatus Peribacteria bacterium RIFCSPLOWO2_12_FULL_55_15]
MISVRRENISWDQEKKFAFGGKGQMLRPQAAKGWRVLVQNPRFRNWQAAFAKIRTDFSTSGCGG